MTLRDLFPNAHFSLPATEAQIQTAERALGVWLPEQLRSLYLQCDGFREDRGNAKYLFSLTDFVFFGSTSGDESWGIDLKTGRSIIAYHHQMEDAYEIVGSEIVTVWQDDYSKYELSSEPRAT